MLQYSAEKVFSKSPELLLNVEKKRKLFSTVLQAGLTINGILLQQ